MDPVYSWSLNLLISTLSKSVVTESSPLFHPPVFRTLEKDWKVFAVSCRPESAGVLPGGGTGATWTLKTNKLV